MRPLHPIRTSALLRLCSVLLLPVACASYESDPSKIPDPVAGPRADPAQSSPGAVAADGTPTSPTPTSPTSIEPASSEPIMTHSGRASEPGAEECNAVRTPELVRRVGGDMQATIEIKDGVYRFGPSRIESPLPAGYPEPTPPGAIDLKHYPTVRRAEFVSTASPGMGMNGGFWPLFNHIKRNDIAMTSPVEMDYRGMFDPKTGERVAESTPSWTMSFLYRTAELAPTGRDGVVLVTDRPEIEVLAVGMNGPYGTGVVEKGLGMIAEWLAANPGYETCGDPRAFHYNGPYIPNRVKWSEIQVPVRRKAPDAG